MRVSTSILITHILIFINSFSVYAKEDKNLEGPPIVIEGPLKVQIGFNLMNITDINERQETIDFDAAIYLNWMDPILVYEPADVGLGNDHDPSDYSRAPRRIYQGEFQIEEIFRGWRPHFVIPNGIGNRITTNMSISIWPDGRVEYAETFYAKVETPMNMRLFPFDKQELEIFFHPFIYQRDEIVLIPDDRLARTWDQNMGIAEWKRNKVFMKEQPVEIAYFDDSKETVSELIVTIDIEREPIHVLISIILPMVILVSLTWCVFWMKNQNISGRVNILFIGILSVVAYYFVIQENLPKISYLTLIDGFIITTFLVLAAGIIISVIVEKLDLSGRKETGDKLDRICRWAFPVGYIIISFLIGILFINLP